MISDFYVLAINPGSTSTKIALYHGEKEVIKKNIEHSAEELSKYKNIADQYEFRKSEIESFLNDSGIDQSKLSAIVGRGGLLPPVKSGGYIVNDAMVERLKNRPVVEHASNLGAIIAHALAKPLKIQAYIYDSVSVDELSDIARISGMQDIARESFSHALNMRAVAIKCASQANKKYEDLNILVAHLGGGISISVHEKGKMVDIVSDDEGPFSPERSGRVPCKRLIEMCYSSKFEKNEMMKKLRGNGGLISYLGTSSALEVENMIKNGDPKAEMIYKAMAYQISKGIGELATVVKGKVDMIIITGGIAYSNLMTGWINERVDFIAPVYVVPGENEMEALAFGTMRILSGSEKAMEYNID